MEQKDKGTIIFSFHNADFFSGATRSLLDMLDRFIKEKEFEIIAIFPTLGGSAIEYLKERGVEVLYCPVKSLVQDEKQPLLKRIIKFPFFFLWYFQAVTAVKKIMKNLKRKNIISVYSNTSINLTGALLQKYFKIPNIWHFREYRHEDHQIHYFLGDRLFTRFANKYSSKIIFISKSMYEFHEAKGFDKSKMLAVYNDISPRYYLERNWNEELRQPIRLLIAGDVKEGKGQLELLKALKIVSEKGIDWSLTIAGNFGDNDYCKEILRYIEKNDMKDRVKIAGIVKEMNSLRVSCDIGIVASKKEAFGRVTVEGMLAGLAMIGSNTGGTVELIKDGKTGLLYQLGDERDLAQKIFLLATNEGRLRQLAKEGQEYAAKNFIKGVCYQTIREQLLVARTK